MPKLPTYFVSHGGGPWPWMKTDTGAMYDRLEASFKDMRRELEPSPRAVLMVSGHWEAERYLLSSAPRPPMLYDYYGFPPHTYQIRYDAPGAPELAADVQDLLEKGGVGSGLDGKRGFDHGTFCVMYSIYPEAEMPVVQLSLNAHFDPAEHIEVGKLLAPLRDYGVLIIGSGLSYHNLRDIRSANAGQASAQFDRWLGETLVESAPQERLNRLLHWAEAPAARAAHPREDHLLPLMVALGAAFDEAGERVYHESDFMGQISVSSYRFGGPLT
jgi:aromatic ring-opening dioxygenase catalytic subunit (LigB family)